MRRDLLDVLRCPRCRTDRPFDLAEAEVDEREVRSGELTCRECAHVARVEDGIVDLMHDPPEFVVREARGLERFAEEMRNSGWDRERVLKLPYEQSGYWFAQAAGMENLLREVAFEPGERLLDVGANTCWASNVFAQRGLDVTALDIATPMLQGLRTAEWWMDANDVHFERVLSVMFDPALASGSFDHVLCSEVLHHNHPANLRRTLAELHRVLKPGGRLLVLNEPLKFPSDRKPDHAQEVAGYDGHEHVYFLHEYLLAARRAGFRAHVVTPQTLPVFRGEPLTLRLDEAPRTTVKTAAQQLLRRTRAGTRAIAAWKLLLGPEVSLSLICEKPAAA